MGAVRCRDNADVGALKPAPAVYIAALRALDVAPAEAIALEDSPRGVQAARSPGVFSVPIPNAVTRRMGAPNAGLTLDSMAEMTLQQLVQAAEAKRA